MDEGLRAAEQGIVAGRLQGDDLGAHLLEAVPLRHRAVRPSLPIEDRDAAGIEP